MANRNEERNPGQQPQDSQSQSQTQRTEGSSTKRKGAEGREQGDVSDENNMQAGGTRKPDRTNEGERGGNSNDRQQSGGEEGGMGGSQQGNRGGQNSGNNR